MHTTQLTTEQNRTNTTPDAEISKTSAGKTSNDSPGPDTGHETGRACAAPSCWGKALRYTVEGATGRQAVLCRRHAKAFLGVSS